MDLVFDHGVPVEVLLHEAGPLHLVELCLSERLLEYLHQVDFLHEVGRASLDDGVRLHEYAESLLRDRHLKLPDEEAFKLFQAYSVAAAWLSIYEEHVQNTIEVVQALVCQFVGNGIDNLFFDNLA